MPDPDCPTPASIALTRQDANRAGPPGCLVTGFNLYFDGVLEIMLLQASPWPAARLAPLEVAVFKGA